MDKFLTKLRDSVIITFMLGFSAFIFFMIIEDAYIHPKKLKEAIDKKQTLICSENRSYKEVKTYRVYEKYIIDTDKNKTYFKHYCEPLN